MAESLVSIITVTFNSERYLEQTIRSVIQQDYPAIEYIIGDGGSTDRTLEIVSKYSNKISRLLTNLPRGIFTQLNECLKLARGEIIGIIHSDDYYADNTVIGRVADIFEHNQNIEIIYGKLAYLNRRTERLLFEWGRDSPPSEIKKRMYIPHPTVFCRRKLYDKVGLFKTKYLVASDYEWAMRVTKYTKPFFIDYRIACMRDMGRSGRHIFRCFSESVMALWENKYYLSAVIEVFKSCAKYLLIKCGLRFIVYRVWIRNVSTRVKPL